MSYTKTTSFRQFIFNFFFSSVNIFPEQSFVSFTAYLYDDETFIQIYLLLILMIIMEMENLEIFSYYIKDN